MARNVSFVVVPPPAPTIRSPRQTHGDGVGGGEAPGDRVGVADILLVGVGVGVREGLGVTGLLDGVLDGNSSGEGSAVNVSGVMLGVGPREGSTNWRATNGMKSSSAASTLVSMEPDFKWNVSSAMVFAKDQNDFDLTWLFFD